MWWHGPPTSVADRVNPARFADKLPTNDLRELSIGGHGPRARSRQRSRLAGRPPKDGRPTFPFSCSRGTRYPAAIMRGWKPGKVELSTSTRWPTCWGWRASRFCMRSAVSMTVSSRSPDWPRPGRFSTWPRPWATERPRILCPLRTGTGNGRRSTTLPATNSSISSSPSFKRFWPACPLASPWMRHAERGAMPPTWPTSVIESSAWIVLQRCSRSHGPRCPTSSFTTAIFIASRFPTSTWISLSARSRLLTSLR